MVEKKFTIGWLLRNLFLWFVLLIIAFPILHMIAVSISGSKDVYDGAVSIFPLVNGKLGVTFATYKRVFEDTTIFLAYKNTIIYTVVGTVIALFVHSTGAYALSRANRFLGGKTINILVLITMFFGGGMIPSFLCMKSLGLVNTIWAIVLPPAFGAYNCIIMRTFFAGFPKEIEESGRLDGLNDIGILWYLVLPTSTAVLATIGLFVAVAQWNNFMGPLIYLTNEAGEYKYPLQIYLRQIVLMSIADNIEGAARDTTFPQQSINYATIAVAVLPIIAVYPFLQKYFVKGVMIGSVKG